MKRRRVEAPLFYFARQPRNSHPFLWPTCALVPGMASEQKALAGSGTNLATGLVKNTSCLIGCSA